MNLIKTLVFLIVSVLLYSVNLSSEKETNTIYAGSVPTNDSLIYWNSNYQLKWSDFKGKVDSLSNHKAVTTSGIGLSAENQTDSLIVNIPAYFEKYSSWTKKNSGSENLLSHEQLHFDIAELVARKIRQKLSSLTYSDIKIIYKSIQEIYNDHIRRVWKSYNVYDDETKHGIVIEKQKEWEAKIAKELNELKIYSSPSIVIRKKKK